MTSFLPFALPDIGQEEIQEVVETLESGWITTGPRVRRFEKEFAGVLGGGVEMVAVNSATAGLHLALEALGIGPGDEVIVPTLTFTATAEVVRYLGADPVFVDVDPATFNLPQESIERNLSERTKAVIPVHFAGMACDIHAIIDIARKHGLKVVEDAAHALPTRVGESLVGTLESDATVFSFYATKTMTTGEGGMIATRHKWVADRCRIMRLHGINRDVFDRYVSRRPSWFYEVVAPGFKYNMTDLAAAIGIHQLSKMERFRQRRMEIAMRYDEAFEALPLRLPPHPANKDEHAWHLYVIRLAEDASVTREDFIDAMARLGVGCSVHFIPLHRHPYWREKYQLSKEDFPVAEAIYSRCVSLPIYSRMSDSDIEKVIEAVRGILA
ncbi:MAG: DegT/DnrJ/EryC1/StrS family aminotransferase [Gammaproteobacteria bacterium]|nr:MAG: DegT/DnrJ/EryC1/StrS family aminotransferase [Gammaproteobacteria bacterium]